MKHSEFSYVSADGNVLVTMREHWCNKVIKDAYQLSACHCFT